MIALCPNSNISRITLARVPYKRRTDSKAGEMFWLLCIDGKTCANCASREEAIGLIDSI